MRQVSKKPEYPTMISRELTLTHKIPTLKLKRFWDGIMEGKIYATKCRGCGKVYYPPQADCTACLRSDMEWIELSREGTIRTFAASYIKPQGFEHFETPYTIAIVETREGIKVMGILEGVDHRNVRVGMKVKISTGTDERGFPIILFQPKERSNK